MADFIPDTGKELQNVFERLKPFVKQVKNWQVFKLDKSGVKAICCTIILGVHAVFKLVDLFLGLPPVVGILVDAFAIGLLAAVTFNMQEFLEFLSQRKSTSKSVAEIEAEIMVNDSFAYLDDRLRKISAVMQDLEKMKKPMKQLKKKGTKQELEDMLKEYHNCILSVRIDVNECFMKLEYLKPYIESAITKLGDSSGEGDSNTVAIKMFEEYRLKCNEYEKRLNEYISHILKKESTVKDFLALK